MSAVAGVVVQRMDYDAFGPRDGPMLGRSLDECTGWD